MISVAWPNCTKKAVSKPWFQFEKQETGKERFSNICSAGKVCDGSHILYIKVSQSKIQLGLIILGETLQCSWNLAVLSISSTNLNNKWMTFVSPGVWMAVCGSLSLRLTHASLRWLLHIWRSRGRREHMDVGRDMILVREALRARHSHKSVLIGINFAIHACMHVHMWLCAFISMFCWLPQVINHILHCNHLQQFTFTINLITTVQSICTN